MSDTDNLPIPPNNLLYNDFKPFNLLSISNKSLKTLKILNYIDKLINISNINEITPINLIRQIDSLRIHSPTEQERDLLNISSSRLTLTSNKDVLLLSGGCSGVRYSTDEINLTRLLTSQLNSLCIQIDTIFNTLPTNKRKISLNDYEDGVDNDIQSFYKISEEIMNIFTRLKDFIKNKQETIQKSNEKFQFDNDPDGIGANKYPQWLELLINKFYSEEAKLLNTRLQCNFTDNLTKGKLAVFISFCLIGVLSCDQNEYAALQQLIHASNDTHLFYSYHDNFLSVISSKPQNYWANRIYNFIKKIDEIKSMPSDEKSLHLIK